MHTIARASLHRILMICVILSILISASCGALPPGQSEAQPGGQREGQPEGENPPEWQAAEGAADPGSGEEAEAEVNGDDLEVRFLEEAYEPARFASEPLGSVSFGEDAGAAVERELTPEDEAVELQVVDGAGLTWTLKIPAGALDDLVTVRMVPLTGVDGSSVSEIAGNVTGGVRLEPDGLTFREPVELTARGAGLEGPTLILSGNQDGGEIDYALQDVAADDPTARVLHFSTYFASPLPDPMIVQAYQQAQKEYNRLAAEAKKMRRNPLDVPTPPSIPLDCPDEKTKKAVEEFVQNALNPETGLAGKMLTQWRIIALTSDSPVEGIPDLVVGLSMRLVRKATAMIKQYYKNEDKLVAVSAFALRAARQLALLGGDNAVIEQILDDLAGWNEGLIDKLINEIGKKHNYKRIPTAVRVAYHAALLGKADQTRDFLDKLREVLRFEAKVTYSMEDPFVKAHNTTEAIVPLQFEPSRGWLYRCSGEGTGKPLEAAVDEEGWAINAYEYPVKIQITGFDPCKGTLTFSIDRFGSDGDTATFKDYSGSWNVSQLSAESLFEAETQDGWFTFTLPVQNENAVMVDHTIERTREDDMVSGSLEIQIVHK